MDDDLQEAKAAGVAETASTPRFHPPVSARPRLVQQFGAALAAPVVGFIGRAHS
jgi:hypothetical protein